jgi:hypothetical protein
MCHYAQTTTLAIKYIAMNQTRPLFSGFFLIHRWVCPQGMALLCAEVWLTKNFRYRLLVGDISLIDRYMRHGSIWCTICNTTYFNSHISLSWGCALPSELSLGYWVTVWWQIAWSNIFQKRLNIQWLMNGSPRAFWKCVNNQELVSKSTTHVLTRISGTWAEIQDLLYYLQCNWNEQLIFSRRPLKSMWHYLCMFEVNAPKNIGSLIYLIAIFCICWNTK